MKAQSVDIGIVNMIRQFSDLRISKNYKGG